MLKRLEIRNYALIRELEIEFSPGLTTITGETGAGKSILLGALSLILGQRADASVLQNKEVKCIVEGVFHTSGYDLESLFLENDLDYDPIVILRREIAPGGKSRAFINDTPVNLKTMQDLCSRLIDIHSQHQSLELANRNFQLMVLDHFAGSKSNLSDYQNHFKTYKKLIADLQEAEDRIHRMTQEMDWIRFQHEQLLAANLILGEQESIEQELALLTHAEEVKYALMTVFSCLNGETDPALFRVKEAMASLAKIKRFYPASDQLMERLNSVYLELQDIASEVTYAAEKIEVDPARTQALTDRLDTLFALLQKHHLQTVDELIVLRDQYGRQLESMVESEAGVAGLKAAIQKEKAILEELAGKLSDIRTHHASILSNQVVSMLQQLGMANARFVVDIQPREDLGPQGRDVVSFLFSANKNSELCEISKVASGGELSRLMLCVKAMISRSKALPTILFDEIDTGISGEIAHKMGTILKEISAGMQVINITHLPQIAAKGDSHYLVFKADTASETVTSVRMLTKEERVQELAKMLSGENVTDAAIRNALELLG
ncbi:MAG: DNA repair protein RecN [Marinilabiliales bacterium]|nr:DNA repair protein RecN [Marinilabiliales bacterium]